MTDRWERPVADDVPAHRRDAVVVDVPLTGDAEPTRPGVEAEPPTTNWRRLMGVAMVIGVVAGMAVTVIRFATDDDESETGSPFDDPATTITTPPTLRPLETLPLPGGTDALDAPDAAAIEPVNAPTPPDPVTVPVYPPAEGAVLSEIVQFDVVAALAGNDDDVARRADTHVELGYGGYVLDVSIERDPVNDRYRLVLASSDAREEVIVDVASGTTYIDPGTENTVTVRNDDVVTAGDAVDVDDYFDRLLRGPFRTDTYGPVATRGRGLVTIDGVGDAREYVTHVDGDLVPEWQIYSLGPVREFVPADRPDVLEYAVYVDAADRIVQVDGVAMLGTVPQLVQHRITLLDEPFAIELPDEPPDPESAAPAG